MPMQSRYSTEYGLTDSTQKYFNADRSQVTGIVSSNALQTSRTTSFTVHATGKGNYKSPVPHSFEKIEVGTHRGFVFQSFNFGSFWYDNSVNGFFEPVAGTAAPPSALFDETLERAYSDFMDGVRGTLDISVDMFQHRQARDMIQTAGLRLLSFARRFNPRSLRRSFVEFSRDPRRNLRRWRRGVNGAGSLWLEFQYGWKPLAQTIFDSIKLATQPNKSQFTKVRGRASAGKRIVEISSTSEQKTTRYIDHSVRREFVGLIALNDSFVERVAAMSSMNPASIAWELTPYSFIVDWFVNIGGYLRNLESYAVYAAGWMGGYSTLTSRTEIQSDIVTSVTDPNGYQSGSRTGKWRRVSKSRTVLNTFPFPPPPRLTCDLGSGRLLNAAALLSQHLRGR